MKRVFAWILLLLAAAIIAVFTVKMVKNRKAALKNVPETVPETSAQEFTDIGETTAESDAEIALETFQTAAVLPREEVSIDLSTNADEAFESGNRCYQDENYSEAEAWYELAAEKQEELTRYKLWEIRNNLGLAKLQFQDNKAAYDIFLDILTQVAEKKSKNDENVPGDDELYGIRLNLLTAAQACGITARDALISAGGEENPDNSDAKLSELLSTLESKITSDPGKYAKLYNGLLYNALYMDIEIDPADRIGKVIPYPNSETVGSNGARISALVLADHYEGGNRFMTRSLDLLNEMQERNEKYFGEKDPDIEDLINYILFMEKTE